MRKTVLIGAVLIAITSHATAQTQEKASGANPGVAGLQQMYSMVKSYITRSAEQVPEDKYGFQPTKDVRTFGQIIAHISDAQRTLCSAAKGKELPYADTNEKTVTGKVALIAKLKESFTACDAVYSATTDAALGNATTVFGQKSTISNALAMNTSHDWEHYGNLVTYLRLMGMVPPSSQGN
jgi:uncharacterized damage-inducible protein DinB